MIVPYKICQYEQAPMNPNKTTAVLDDDEGDDDASSSDGANCLGNQIA